MRPILAAALLAASPAFAETLPQPVRDMVEAAAETGDKGKIDVVVAIAKQTNKGAEAEIDAIVAAHAANRAAARQAALAEAGFLDNWKGRGQLGAALSTGNSDVRSLTVGLNLQRDGIDWRHRIDAVFDITDNRKGSDQERILGGYQLDYKISDRAYSWGRLEYERNREAGIKRRFAESAGLGWRALRGKAVRWDLEAGPALRQTRFVDYTENSVAGRGASRFAWKLSGATEFTSDTAIFFDSSATINNTAALTARMFGALATRLSYNLAWEQDPPVGLQSLDTTTRVTLVYDF
jgi:putative salt-induced outer membrane protein